MGSERRMLMEANSDMVETTVKNGLGPAAVCLVDLMQRHRGIPTTRLLAEDRLREHEQATPTTQAQRWLEPIVSSATVAAAINNEFCCCRPMVLRFNYCLLATKNKLPYFIVFIYYYCYWKYFYRPVLICFNSIISFYSSAYHLLFTTNFHFLLLLAPHHIIHIILLF